MYFSMVFGIGSYTWFSWLESRDQLKGSAKTVCASLSRWRIFQPCCKKGIGIWLRASQVNFMENPLNKAVELKEIRSVVEDDKDMVIARLRERNEKLEDTIKQLQDANRQLQEEIKTLK